MNDAALSETEVAALRCLAGMIIPPSAKYDVPTLRTVSNCGFGRPAHHIAVRIVVGSPTIWKMICVKTSWCSPTKTGDKT